MQGLRALRKKGRWRVKEIADLLGVAVVTVYNYESGTRFPKRDAIAKLCEFFKCTYEELL